LTKGVPGETNGPRYREVPLWEKIRRRANDNPFCEVAPGYPLTTTVLVASREEREDDTEMPAMLYLIVKHYTALKFLLNSRD